jgi:hypothetical protein
MPRPRPNSRQVDPATLERLQPVLNEWLAACLIDEGYAVALSRYAVAIQTRRALNAAKLSDAWAQRKAAVDAREADLPRPPDLP